VAGECLLLRSPHARDGYTGIHLMLAFVLQRQLSYTTIKSFVPTIPQRAPCPLHIEADAVLLASGFVHRSVVHDEAGSGTKFQDGDQVEKTKTTDESLSPYHCTSSVENPQFKKSPEKSQGRRIPSSTVFHLHRMRVQRVQRRILLSLCKFHGADAESRECPAATEDRRRAFPSTSGIAVFA
jgi:hypothetical protein